MATDVEPERVSVEDGEESWFVKMGRESKARWEADRLTWTDTEYAVDFMRERRSVAIQLGKRILKRAIRHLEDRCEAELFGRSVGDHHPKARLKVWNDE